MGTVFQHAHIHACSYTFIDIFLCIEDMVSVLNPNTVDDEDEVSGEGGWVQASKANSSEIGKARTHSSPSVMMRRDYDDTMLKMSADEDVRRVASSLSLSQAPSQPQQQQTSPYLSIPVPPPFQNNAQIGELLFHEWDIRGAGVVNKRDIINAVKNDSSFSLFQV